MTVGCGGARIDAEVSVTEIIAYIYHNEISSNWIESWNLQRLHAQERTNEHNLLVCACTKS